MNDAKTLSCFVDETGDFGAYDSHCPYYMVALVLHNQSDTIEKQISGMEQHLADLGYSNHTLHAGPLVRREADYKYMFMEERKKLFNLLFNFARKVPIHYLCVKVKKSECNDSDELDAKLTKAIKIEIQKSKLFWSSFEKIIIYYDNGQKALKKVLNITFNSIFSDVELRKVIPSDYRLFQVADLFCTLELINSKIEMGLFSKSENEFFHGKHGFKKDYWQKVKKMKL